MLPNKTIGERIYNARKRAGLTQEDLAQQLHVTKQAVSDWELGKHSPGIDLLPQIEDYLHIRIYRTEERSPMNLIDLKEIESLPAMNQEITAILEQLPIDSSSEHSIKRLLRLTLNMILAYECYWKRDSRLEKEQGPVEWEEIAWSLEDLLDRKSTEPIPAGKDYPFSCPQYLMAKKIGFITFQIGSDLFEDFDETGYRDGYLQQLGHLGESSGYELLNILPDFENSLVTKYKLALSELAEKLGGAS